METLLEAPTEPDPEHEPERPRAEDGDQAGIAPAPEYFGRFSRERLELGIEVVVVGILVYFVFRWMRPDLIFANTTPAGGDMGAHVWGPAYLRDHLLEHFRLTGWTPDWYAGFPAYVFYMVIPSLLVVLVNFGASGGLVIVPLVIVALLGWEAVRRGPGRARQLAIAAIPVVLLVGIHFPYGVSFKIVTALGIVTLPIATYVFGRCAGLKFPTPMLLSAASLLFLFNREPNINNTGNIIGGNVASTMAGEFAFSISLTLTVLYLALLVRGLRTGRNRAGAAVLFGLAVLSHPIAALLGIVGTATAFLVWWGWARLKWIAVVLPVGMAISAFWALPFVGQRHYITDMGWKKLPDSGYGFADYLFNHMRLIVIVAVVGAILSVVRGIKPGIFLALTAMVFGLAFVFMPQMRLWNARLLPAYLFCVFLLVGIAVAELTRLIAVLVAHDTTRPPFSLRAGAAVVAAFAALMYVAVPLGAAPFERQAANGSYSWFGFKVPFAKRNVVDDWIQWNYSGYERKATYPEYYDFIQTMGKIGQDQGCGRAMWEYESERLNSYGTPMAPMLLPFWTDGCIGSMEGLYFESSTTTPYHFLMQSELSAAPSQAMRDLPYSGFQMADGVLQMKLMGVRYYAAFSNQAVQAAAQQEDLREIATSGPWHIYEIVYDGDAATLTVVEPLTNEPAVLSDVHPGREWLKPSLDFFDDPPSWDVFLAANGPSDWQRVKAGDRPERRPVPPATITNVKTTDNSISFDVDQPGRPVLVKTSYFPNWKASGADGPYRVTPNLMVVVPKDNSVKLEYGNSSFDLMGWFLTLVGIALVIFLAFRPPVPVPAERIRALRLSRRQLSGSSGDGTYDGGVIVIEPAPLDSEESETESELDEEHAPDGGAAPDSAPAAPAATSEFEHVAEPEPVRGSEPAAGADADAAPDGYSGGSRPRQPAPPVDPYSPAPAEPAPDPGRKVFDWSERLRSSPGGTASTEDEGDEGGQGGDGNSHTAPDDHKPDGRAPDSG